MSSYHQLCQVLQLYSVLVQAPCQDASTFMTAALIYCYLTEKCKSGPQIPLGSSTGKITYEHEDNISSFQGTVSKTAVMYGYLILRNPFPMDQSSSYKDEIFVLK